MGSGNLENLPSESGTGEPQLGPKVLGLNAEGVLKILGAQKLLAEVSVGGNLPLNVFHEGAYLLLIGARNVSHGPLDHINVGLRGESHPFEIFKHHGSYGFERVFFGFHVTLAASLLLDKRERVLASRDEAAEKEGISGLKSEPFGRRPDWWSAIDHAVSLGGPDVDLNQPSADLRKKEAAKEPLRRPQESNERYLNARQRHHRHRLLLGSQSQRPENFSPG